MKLRETGYAAINILTKPPYIMVWSIAGSASQAKMAVTNNWTNRNGDRPTWDDVKREGVRVRKVTIETI